MWDKEGEPKSRRGGELGTRPTSRIANSKKAVAARVDWNHVSHMTNYPTLRIGVLRALQNLKRHYRSEEHTSELQSLMRISYAVFCLKKKKHTTTYKNTVTYCHIQHT